MILSSGLGTTKVGISDGVRVQVRSDVTVVGLKVKVSGTTGETESERTEGERDHSWVTKVPRVDRLGPKRG